MEIKGYSNRFLDVNLTTRKVKEFSVSEKELKMYLGGKGLGMKLLYDRLKPGIEPLSEDNILAIMMGAFMGTGAINSGRFDAVTKSPLTGIMVSSSCGGPFGMAFKTAGYCGLLLSGKSESPVYLEINESEVLFKDATNLLGKDTQETQEILKQKNAGILAIGQAGENLVKFANVASGHRFLGRGGIGAVMGSKNLKAIVAHGKKVKIVPKNEEKFKKIKKRAQKYIKTNNFTGNLYKTFGTNSHVNLSHENNILPVNNFQFSEHEEAYKVSGEEIEKQIGQKPSVCKPCSIICGHKATFPNGQTLQVAEYETTGLLGPNLGIFDSQQIAIWNDMAGRYGMDTISLGTTLSYATEASEKGLIKSDLKFGNTTAFTRAIENIALGKDLGKEMAEGVRNLSEKYGGKEYAIHVKGMEISAYDPRGSWGQGLAYAVSNRGACHLSATMFTLEPYLKLLNPYKTSAKAKFVHFFEKLNSAINSLHVCQFTSYAYLLEPAIVKYTPKFMLGLTMQYLPDIAIMLMDVSIYSGTWSSITGIKLLPKEMLEAGERIHLLERYMNTREGISKKDDILPARISSEPRPEDAKQRTIPLAKMLKEYYKIKGYDENGIPKKEKLEKMGIL